MKKRVVLCIAIAAVLSGLGGCDFLGGEKPAEKVIIDITPTPVIVEVTPTPTPVPKSTKYISQDKTFGIKLPDTSWSVKTEENKAVSFESPEQGKILIERGNAKDLKTVVIPGSKDIVNALEKADDDQDGAGFTVKSYETDVYGGAEVIQYVVQYTDPAKHNGASYVIHKWYSNQKGYYGVTGTVTGDETALKNIAASMNTFVVAALEKARKAGVTAPEGQGQGTAGATGAAEVDENGNLTDAAKADTNQTRTIYTNDGIGTPILIFTDGNGGWLDSNGNTYTFVGDTDAYNQNEESFYYGGESGEVYLMSEDEELDATYDTDATSGATVDVPNDGYYDGYYDSYIGNSEYAYGYADDYDETY
ncbi:MAG: hypothetical protein HUJ72_01255 [Blautia sp.]|nr:hypothetical protein [Blautia sp.]